MSRPDDVTASPRPEAHAPRRERLPSTAGRGLALLYTHNPFYLLSTAFALHGSARWMQHAGGVGGYDPWPLIGLIAGYVLMMAATAVVIVRAGGVWEDARSILLIIPALFVELALTFDDPLVSDRPTGAALAVTGFLFAAAVTEGLLWGLRIRLTAAFRLPLHTLLALVFLYPLLIVPAIDSGQESAASWRIFLFFPATALALLTLLPAVRRGPAAVAGNGTPWRWPWFPWGLFAVLVVGVCVRGYALGLSFDPVLSLGYDAAMQLSSAWGPYFLVPVLLAAGVLVLEAGLVTRNRPAQAAALAVPAVCVLLALPWGSSVGPHAEFLAEFTRQAGSPLWLALTSAAVFYAVALWHRVRGAEPALVTTLLVLTMAGPQTISPAMLTAPRPLALLAVGGVLLAAGLCKRDSRRSLLAALLGVTAVATGPLSDGPAWVQGFVPVQLAGLSVFVVGRSFDDTFARWLLPLGAAALLVGVVASLLTLLDPPPSVPAWTVPTYLVLLIALAFAAAYPLGSRLYFWTGAAGLALAMAEFLRRSLLPLRDEPHFSGLGSFLIAFALFLLAAGVSAAKAGLGRHLAALLPSDRDERGS